MTPDNIIYCECGAEIGSYTERDGHVFLLVGNYRIRDAWGWCNVCGASWVFNTSEKQLGKLIRKLIDARQEI